MGLNDFTVDQQGRLTSLVLHWPPSVSIADEQFFTFCQANQGLKIERAATGDFEIMSPTGWETGRRNLSLAAQLYVWAEQDGTGIASDSSTGFILPNGAIRSPDVAWIKKTRLATLAPEEKQRFLPLCPDFVIELRSPSDALSTLHQKMQEYMSNGARLAWLIDPETRQVSIYQADGKVLNLENPEFVMADEVVAGFKLELQKIWGFGS